jgi:hypothetical protein
MTAAPSYPPVLNPKLVAYREHLADCEGHLAVHFRARNEAEQQRALTALTIIEAILLPALAHAARVGIARMQESTEERHK